MRYSCIGLRSRWDDRFGDSYCVCCWAKFEEEDEQDEEEDEQDEEEEEEEEPCEKKACSSGFDSKL